MTRMDTFAEKAANQIIVNSKKPIINLALYTPKQRSLYKLNQLTKVLTHLCWFVLYNAIAVFGWIGIINGQHNNAIINQINQYSAYIFYGAGHLTLNAVQGIISWFTKRPKYDKKVYDLSGNPQIKKSIFRIIMLVVIIIPLIVWIIGWIIITCKYIKQDKEIKREQKLKEITQKGGE